MGSEENQFTPPGDGVDKLIFELFGLVSMIANSYIIKKRVCDFHFSLSLTLTNKMIT